MSLFNTNEYHKNQNELIHMVTENNHKLLVNTLFELSSLLDCETDEKCIAKLLADWNTLVENIRQIGTLKQTIAMCDFSVSMGREHDSPYYIALALGLLISETNESIFKNTMLTFDSNPLLLSMQGNLFDKTATLRASNIGQGHCTDFQMALDKILYQLIVNRVEFGKEPDNLIVLTDMNWEAASKDLYFYNKKYKYVVKTIQFQSIIEMATLAFKHYGELIWGKGNGWNPPTIIMWNLVSNNDETIIVPGVKMVCGWSSELFSMLLTGTL